MNLRVVVSSELLDQLSNLQFHKDPAAYSTATTIVHRDTSLSS
jgi:hypothetical protein